MDVAVETKYWLRTLYRKHNNNRYENRLFEKKNKPQKLFDSHSHLFFISPAHDKP